MAILGMIIYIAIVIIVVFIGSKNPKKEKKLKVANQILEDSKVANYTNN